MRCLISGPYISRHSSETSHKSSEASPQNRRVTKDVRESSEALLGRRWVVFLPWLHTEEATMPNVAEIIERTATREIPGMASLAAAAVCRVAPKSGWTVP